MSTTETENTTPEKYRPEPRKYEQKDWLYQQYWGEMKSTIEIAEGVAVTQRYIVDLLDEHGIPRRHPGHEAAGEPLKGFRAPDEEESIDWSEHT